MRVVMSLLWDSLGDPLKFMEDAKENGADTIRLFLITSVGSNFEPSPRHPFKIVGYWNPYRERGVMDRPDVPMVDLTIKDEPSWELLEKIIKKAGELGLALWFVFRDQCGESDQDYLRYYAPFYGCVQMWPGWKTPGFYKDKLEPAISGGGMGPGLDPYHKTFYTWVKELCDKYKVKAYGEPMNEMGWQVLPEHIFTLVEMKWWFFAQCEMLRDLGYTVIGSVRPDMTYEMIEPWCDLIDIHGIGEPADAIKWVNSGLPIYKVIFNTDGAWNGRGDGISCNFKRDVSQDQIRSLGAYAQVVGAAGVCFLSQQQIWSPTEPWDMRLISLSTIRAMAEGLGWVKPTPMKLVLVCAESLALPRIDPVTGSFICPVLDDRYFVVGQEPMAVCLIHKAPAPPVKKKPWYARLWDWIKRLLR